MTDFTLHFDCEPGADAARLQEDLQAGLRQLCTVASPETGAPIERLTGLELLAGITLAASIFHQGAGIVHDVRSVIEDLKAIFKEVSARSQKLGVKKVIVLVGMEPKSVVELTDDDYQTFAQEII